MKNLYRGKLKSNNEWVKGFYVELDGIPCIYGKGEIIRKTLGQCAGLQDENGKEFFEGDVVRYVNEDGQKMQLEVGFSSGCFVAYEKDEGGRIYTVPLRDVLTLGIEIVGNIFDEE